MRSKRTSPTFFKSRAASIACFVLAIALLTLVVYLGVGMLTRFDYDDAIPEDAELRVNLLDDDYVAPTPEPTPTPAPVRALLPTPAPAPSPTPLPLSVYCLQNTRLVMPRKTDAPIQAGMTSLYVSKSDDSKSVVITGYAFLEGYDAEKSKIYLVISGKSAAVRRFYEVTLLPGSTGIHHDPALGQNLDRADFRAAFSVRAYEDGPYRVGVLVVNTVNRKQTSAGYADFPGNAEFTVKSNAVVDAG